MVDICGRVIGERGEGVWNATVVFRPVRTPGATPKFALSEGDGEFTVSGLVPGKYTVIVTQRFYAVHTFTLDVTGDDYIEVALAPDISHPRVY